MFFIMTGIMVLGGCGKQQTSSAVATVVEQTQQKVDESEMISTEQESDIEGETQLSESVETEALGEITSGESDLVSKAEVKKKQKNTVVKKEDNGKQVTVINNEATPLSAVASVNKVEQPATVQSSANTTESSQENANDNHENHVQSPEIVPTQPQSEYKLMWADEFLGDSLNENDWNYELHEPGWVNSELQEYVKSEENIFVKDGCLVIQPCKKEDENGEVRYTSGRVNTQGKHDFKYGRIEARIKVPEGQGYLPAFWMMPTNEQLYGTWPKCGEIDIMEVLGHATDESYATLHYGAPHTSKQVKYKLKSGDFSKEFHDFACEWEPGQMKFFVDNQLIGTQNDWFTGDNGQVHYAYPAPYNQPFYIILNVAVGGDWPQNPDDSTPFDERAQMAIDYVRVYQKETYDENVKRPENNVELREPDENGNFVINGNFEHAELGENKAWNLLLAGNGAATAKIVDGTLKVETTACGNLDYSVQVVQPDIPLEKGYQYELSFEAAAAQPRTMITTISAPECGWIRYFNDTKVNLTQEKKAFSFTFDMTKNTDAKGRIEFNLGNQDSNETVMISNVQLKKVKEIEIEEQRPITVDGTLQNGDFSNGLAGFEVYIDNRANASYKVADKQMQITIQDTGSPDDWYIQLKQNSLRLEEGKWYDISFDAKSDINRKIMYALQRDGSSDNNWEPYSGSNICELTAEYQTFHKTFRMERKTDEKTILSITLGAVSGEQISQEHTVCIDNIVLKEVEEPEGYQKPEEKPEENPEDGDDTQGKHEELIKNGDFSEGNTAWEVYVDNKAEASYEFQDNKALFHIKNPGEEDWNVQLKQGPVTFEKGKTYEIKFKIKSDVARTIKYCCMNKEYIWYGGANIPLNAEEEKEVVHTFTVDKETDDNIYFQFSLGKVDVNDPCKIEIQEVSMKQK